ncbi:hypothetical protein C8J57DRAFT_1253481 [Mycena rebaudengoi]|nr:hypothetical protein C8J57DRAFT_1253481 [Mycena rebaudengoi]
MRCMELQTGFVAAVELDFEEEMGNQRKHGVSKTYFNAAMPGMALHSDYYAPRLHPYAIFSPTSPQSTEHTHSKPLSARSPATPAAISRTPGTARRRLSAPFPSAAAVALRRMCTRRFTQTGSAPDHASERTVVFVVSPNIVGIRRFPAFLAHSARWWVVMCCGLPRGGRSRSTRAGITLLPPPPLSSRAPCAHASHATANANAPQTSVPTRSQQTRSICVVVVEAAEADIRMVQGWRSKDQTTPPAIAMWLRPELGSCGALRRRLSRAPTPPYAFCGVWLGAPAERELGSTTSGAACGGCGAAGVAGRRRRVSGRMGGDVRGPSGLHSGARIAGVAPQRGWRHVLLCDHRDSCWTTSAELSSVAEREDGVVKARCAILRMLRGWGSPSSFCAVRRRFVGRRGSGQGRGELKWMEPACTRRRELCKNIELACVPRKGYNVWKKHFKFIPTGLICKPNRVREGEDFQMCSIAGTEK